MFTNGLKASPDDAGNFKMEATFHKRGQLRPQGAFPKAREKRHGDEVEEGENPFCRDTLGTRSPVPNENSDILD